MRRILPICPLFRHSVGGKEVEATPNLLRKTNVGMFKMTKKQVKCMSCGKETNMSECGGRKYKKTMPRIRLIAWLCYKRCSDM